MGSRNLGDPSCDASVDDEACVLAVWNPQSEFNEDVVIDELCVGRRRIVHNSSLVTLRTPVIANI